MILQGQESTAKCGVLPSGVLVLGKESPPTRSSTNAASFSVGAFLQLDLQIQQKGYFGSRDPGIMGMQSYDAEALAEHTDSSSYRYILTERKLCISFSMHIKHLQASLYKTSVEMQFPGKSSVGLKSFFPVSTKTSRDLEEKGKKTKPTQQQKNPTDFHVLCSPKPLQLAGLHC